LIIREFSEAAAVVADYGAILRSAAKSAVAYKAS
jgi:hypothetical protein